MSFESTRLLQMHFKAGPELHWNFLCIENIVGIEADEFPKKTAKLHFPRSEPSWTIQKSHYKEGYKILEKKIASLSMDHLTKPRNYLSAQGRSKNCNRYLYRMPSTDMSSQQNVWMLYLDEEEITESVTAKQTKIWTDKGNYLGKNLARVWTTFIYYLY